jgi:hypothetical protein
MALMGGLALSLWKRSRFTQDVDLLVEIADEEVPDVVHRLAAVQIRPKRNPPVLTLGEHRLIQFVYEPPESFLCLQIDLLLAQSGYQKECLKRRVPARIPGVGTEIAVLSCEDLILHKVLAGRILDRVDAASLLRANRADLDIGHLTRWADKLNLRSELGEIWVEAFPGETLP